MNDQSTNPIRLGISSCLLGEKVRFDGNHKLDNYILGTLGRFFEFVPVCPEMGIGMGVPRQPIRLVGEPSQPRAVGVKDPERDVTAALLAYGHQQSQQLSGIAGYIFKSKSPSCGMERVKVYQTHMAQRNGVGIYARAFMEGQPLLPVEEEGRLGDPVLRENFIERVFVYRRWQELVAAGLSAQGLVEFHTRHKLIVMSHGTEPYRALGRLVAQAGSLPLAELAATYIRSLMEALRHRATRKRHTNTLHHLMGYLKKQLNSDDKAELLDIIEAYRQEQLPLIVPITLLKHHFRIHPHPYVDQQLYLNPHPRELMLRNGI